MAVAVLLGGYSADRWADRRVLLVSIYLLRAAAFVLPLFVGSNYELLIGFAMIVGIAFYATFPITAGLASAHFGVSNLGLTMGVLVLGHSFGAAVGAFMGGYIYDLFLQYDWMWMVSIAAAIAAALFALAVTDPKSASRRSVSA